MEHVIERIRIRKYAPGDEKEILKLFECVFKRKMTLDYWRWRYSNNPAEHGFISLAFYDDKLIGHYAVVPARAIFKNKAILVALSMTTMTHPEYKGMGIFPLLAKDAYQEARRRGYKLIYGFPNDQSHLGFINKLDWVDGGNMALFASKISNFNSIPHHNLELRKKVKTGNEIEMLSSWVPNNFDFSLEKNSAFYNWRYCDNPTTKYDLYYLEENREIVGFFVIKKYQEDAHTIFGHIVDFLVRDSDYLGDILHYSMKSLCQEKVNEISMWAFEKLASCLKLEENRFEKKMMPRTFFGYRVLDADFFKTYGNLSIDTLFLPMGDSDVF
jgi:GNAT superfamily N-acetyltransferase